VSAGEIVAAVGILIVLGAIEWFQATEAPKKGKK
jgi:hypothetical protein